MLAVVPARGGSKGLRRKNVRLLAGRPLIVHTLECARSARSIDRILVTTDDEEIATIAGAVHGVEVPFRRPPELASDNAAAIDAYLHVADWLTETEGREPKAICVLLPTCPLRIPSDIDGAIDLFHVRQADAVLSVRSGKPLAWHRVIAADGRLGPVDTTPAQEAVANRQVLPDTVVLNGSIFVLNIPWLLRSKTYFGDRSFGYLMADDRSVDIDNEADLQLAEILMKSRSP